MLKKKSLIIALSVFLVGGMAVVAANADKIGAQLINADSTCTSHSGNHYTERAATCLQSGCKEYWVCCKCNEHFFAKPTGTFAEAGKATEVVESTDDRYLEKPAKHVDEDHNLICDICESELPAIEKVTVSAQRTYIGRGEKVDLTAAIEGFAQDLGDVTWSLSSTTYFTISNKGSGKAVLTAKSGTSTSASTVTVTAKSTVDTSVTGTISIKCSTYGSTKVKAIDTLVGSANRPPYFYIANNYVASETEENMVYSYSTDLKTLNSAILAFEGVGGYAKTEKDNKVYFSKAVEGETGYSVEWCLYNTVDTFYVECRRINVTYTTFPTTLVTNFIQGKTTSQFIAPDDGNKFTYTDYNSSLTITSNGDMDAYKTKLVNANYFMVADGITAGAYHAVSPEQTLVIKLTPVTNGYSMAFSTRSAPEGTEWAEADKTMMMKYLGVVVPFVKASYSSWFDYMEDYGYIGSASTRKEAPIVAERTFDKDTSYTKKVNTDGTISYSKTKDTYNDVVLIITGNQIRGCVEQKEFTDWKESEVMTALGTDVEDTLPTPVGTAYKYSFGTNQATYTVKGEYADYITALEDAGYILDEAKSYTYEAYYEAPNGTISLVVSKQGSWFEVNATGHLPKGQYHEFPSALVRKELALKSEELPEPAGTKFTYVDNGDYDCTVIVEGGNKDTYASALEDASFVEGEDYVFISGNISVTLEDHAKGYSARYALVEKPAKPAWPATDIAGILSARGYTDITIPEPTGYTNFTRSEQKTMTLGSYYTYDYTVIEFVFEGVTLADYISQVESETSLEYWSDYPESGYGEFFYGWYDEIMFVDESKTDLDLFIIVSID